jgi:hypothetical protein
MKLINYNYGHTPADPTSGTWYRGKILMNSTEWTQAKKYLMRARLGASYEHRFYKQILREDLKNRIRSVRGNGFHVAIRVPATEKLVRKYQLKGYKRNNYFIHVTP